MGNWTSRQNLGVEEVDIASNNAYKYPPRCGNYFGSHFIMGGERFDTPQPEAYLFGENVDLNFLGNRPTPFPYPPPQANEPTKTLKSLVNIRKESVRFVKAPESVLKTNCADDENKDNKFNLEFTFDCDCRCAITVYYFCTEEITNTGLLYTSKQPAMNSETFHYKRGANQLFSQPSHVFDPSKYTDDELSYDLEKEVIPIAIHCLAEEGVEGEPRQSHTTFAVVDRHSDGTYVLRSLKQKLYVDGLCYLLQEIYGIENKNNESAKATTEEETEDNGSECVICMCDVRDTLILPCRHLCLCNSCADSLRYQANNCPICRAPFRALLQIRALRKYPNCMPNPLTRSDAASDQVPPGYEAVSLIEALNGPYTTRTANVALDMTDSPNSEATIQAAELLNRQNSSEDKNSPGEGKSDYRLSSMMSREDNNRRHGKSGKDKDKKAKSLEGDEREVEKVATEPEQGVDIDSDVEKLSPLLVEKKEPNQVKNTSTQDESDYYTPDEPHSDDLLNDKVSAESTPDRQALTASMPGTPISANSYSSSSSTKQLLTYLPNKIERERTARLSDA